MRVFSIAMSCFIVLNAFVLQSDVAFKTILVNDKSAHIKIDDFGNTYVITKTEILKYTINGLFVKSFSAKRYGSIDFVDVTNPLKILVYYKDFQQILFLDNQLTASSNMISLENLGLEQTSLVCTSVNNSFWLFDKQNNSLLRFNEKSNQLVKIDNLKRVLDMDLKPNFLKEKNNYVYLNCPDEGILVFDMYGSFLKTLPIKKLFEFDIKNENIIYFKDNSLNEYKTKMFTTNSKPFRDSLIKTIYWQGNHFYKVYQDSVIQVLKTD
jgi:hypothetical protein